LNLFIIDVVRDICFNQILVEGELVKKINQNDDMLDRFAVKARLNLSDLLRRRMEENKIDKKANLIIFSSVATIAVVVVLMLSL
jgi:hypothetical protein